MGTPSRNNERIKWRKKKLKMIIPKEVKIRRLESQINIYKQQSKTSNPGVKERYKNAINRRRKAIKYLKSKNLNWLELNKQFNIDIYFH